MIKACVENKKDSLALGSKVSKILLQNSSKLNYLMKENCTIITFTDINSQKNMQMNTYWVNSNDQFKYYLFKMSFANKIIHQVR